jgi:hypothetical protein
MSVLRSLVAEDDDSDRAGGAKAASAGKNASSAGGVGGVGSGGDSSVACCRQPSSLSPSPMTLSGFEASEAAALVFSLAAAALAAQMSPLLAFWVLAEGCFYLWQRYR